MVNLYGLELDNRLRLERSEAQARTERLLRTARPDPRPRWMGVKRGLGRSLVRLGMWVQGTTEPGWVTPELAWK